MKVRDYGSCQCGRKAVGEVFDGNRWQTYCDTHLWPAYKRDFLQEQPKPKTTSLTMFD